MIKRTTILSKFAKKRSYFNMKKKKKKKKKIKKKRMFKSILLSASQVEGEAFHNNNYNFVYISVTILLLCYFLWKMYKMAKENKE